MDSSKKIKRIAWVHNYNREKNPSSGIFMYQFFDAVKSNDSNITIDIVDVGNVGNPFLIGIKYFKYKKILKKYDVLHSQYGSGIGFFVSLFSRPKIVSLRGSDWYYTPTPIILERIHVWLGCFLTKVSLKKYSHTIVMSNSMKKSVMKRFRNISISVLPDPIDLQKFYPTHQKPVDKFRVLFSSVRQTNTGKRFELAEKAFELFNSKYPNSELVFMSGIPHDKVNEYINSVDVIILTSTHEGWPNIIKEGLACNVPFVSTDVSDLRQIADSTDTCFVCDDSPESLFIGLEKTYSNRTKAKELRHFIEFMDIDLISNELIAIYKDIEI